MRSQNLKPFLRVFTGAELISLLTDSNHMMASALRNAIHENRLKIHGDVLDFGCGSKPYIQEFKHCETYIGVDIEISGHNHETSLIDIYYDGSHLPWPDETFDSVVAFEVFEHLPDPAKSLQEIKRVLKSNGVLLITVPFLYGEHEIPHDFQRWTSFGIEKFFEDMDFTDIQVSKINQTPVFAIQLFINVFMNKIKYHESRLLRVPFVPLIIVMNLSIGILQTLLPKTPWFYSNILVTAKKS